MSSVEQTITTRRDAGSGSLIAYLPIGFPTLDESVEAAIAVVENGVDILELGLPYSDPVMDGAAIQKATQTALQNGFRLRDAFTAVERVRAAVDAPVLVMTYWNPVMQYGVDRFAADLKNAGGAGLITPDLIPDEASEWMSASEAHDLDRVFLAAPSSSDVRMRQAVEASRGFVYAVSTMGITGARSDVDAAARGVVSRLRDAGCTSTCVGLGISTAEQVRDVLSYADGAIVGSRLVAALSEGGVPEVARVAADLASGTR